MKFDVEKEADSGRLKAVNVTNRDGSPIVPPPRQPRRNRPTSGEGDATDDAAAAAAEPEGGTAPTDTKNGGRGRGRSSRGGPGGGNNNRRTNGGNRRTNTEGGGEGTAGEGGATSNNSTTPREPPFHSHFSEDLRTQISNKGIVLGNRTTIDVALAPHARIKLGQGGYAGICLQTAIVGEGTYVCDPSGALVTFTWLRALKCSADGDAVAWKPYDATQLLPSFSLLDGTCSSSRRSPLYVWHGPWRTRLLSSLSHHGVCLWTCLCIENVGPVQPNETAATLWGADKPDPREAFDLSKKMDFLSNEMKALRTDNKALRENQEAQARQITKLQENDKKRQQELNGIRSALEPATTFAMAETCVYKQVEELTFRLISQDKEISEEISIDQEGLQYLWSKVGMQVLDELIQGKRAQNKRWRGMLLGKMDAALQTQEHRTEAICAILSGLSFFVKTVPSSVLLNWPPARNIVVHDGNFLHALHGPYESKNEIDDVQKVVGQIQSWVPPKLPALQVPNGGSYETENTRRQMVEPFLDSLVNELVGKFRGHDICINRLQTTKQFVLTKLCRN